MVAIYMASWGVVGWIEISAFHQPKSPTAVYRYPHDIKGATRYFAPKQEEIYSVAKPIMFAALGVGFIVMIFAGWLDRQIKERDIRQALERDTKGEPLE